MALLRGLRAEFWVANGLGSTTDLDLEAPIEDNFDRGASLQRKSKEGNQLRK